MQRDLFEPLGLAGGQDRESALVAAEPKLDGRVGQLLAFGGILLTSILLLLADDSSDEFMDLVDLLGGELQIFLYGLLAEQVKVTIPAARTAVELHRDERCLPREHRSGKDRKKESPDQLCFHGRNPEASLDAVGC